MSIIIKIYKTNDSNKSTLAASFTDEDECLFSSVLFQEALYHFENTEDPFHVFPYTVEEISNCQKGLQHKVKDLPSHINTKINNIKKYNRKTWRLLYYFHFKFRFKQITNHQQTHDRLHMFPCAYIGKLPLSKTASLVIKISQNPKPTPQQSFQH